MTAPLASGMFGSVQALEAMRAASLHVQDRPVPEPILHWLARLRLLHGVPFHYLVADSALLPPPESIRFFHVDRNWTDAACDGALSVAAGTRERAHLKARHPELRDAVDAAERTLRHSAVHPGETLDAPPDTPVSGFLLRSRLVSGWPALQVRATRKDDAKNAVPVALVRLERLAPAVLLAMFDGIPERVTLEEPHQGVQFGFDQRPHPAGPGPEFEVPARDGQPAAGPVPFRQGGPGVVDVVALTQLLGTGDSARLARRLLQFPFRQDFCKIPGPADVVFEPSITLAELNATVEDPP